MTTTTTPNGEPVVVPGTRARASAGPVVVALDDDGNAGSLLRHGHRVAVVGLWFPGVLSAAPALLLAGLALVGAAVVVARRRRAGSRGPDPTGPATGRPTLPEPPRPAQH